MRGTDERIFNFERFTLDLKRGCLRVENREVELRPKSFEVLRYFVENAGRLVPKDELIKTIWPNVTVTDESLARCVSDIRLALNDSEQRLIKTLPRRGYLFAAPVSLAVANSLPAEMIDRTNGNNLERNKAAISAKEGIQSPPPLSLIVLPFKNLSEHPTHDWLADAITEGITTYLSRIRNAFVIAHSTALTYKGKAFDVRRVGQELGVRYAIEGSEQRDGPRVRVSAQLIDVETGAHLWADRFDADRADLLQMQDEIVTRLARALEIELADAEAVRISRTSSINPDPKVLVQHAEAIFLKFGPNREESEAAFELCERALTIDPNNARALSILAEKFAARVTGMQSTDREIDIQRADDLASRALTADPNSYQAHHAKARTLIAQKRAEEAMIEAERSLRLNPSFISPYFPLCQANLMLGLPEKTIEYANRAMRLSPPDPYLYLFYAQQGLAYLMLTQDDRAIACLRLAVANNPKFPAPVAYLTAALALTGQQAEARDILRQYLSLKSTQTRTIAGFRALAYSDKPIYLAFRERIYEGLRKAGMPEQ